jgi:hypothetical protein
MGDSVDFHEIWYEPTLDGTVVVRCWCGWASEPCPDMANAMNLGHQHEAPHTALYRHVPLTEWRHKAG